MARVGSLRASLSVLTRHKAEVLHPQLTVSHVQSICRVEAE
uniref:Uncharacterized protein n=1 Tax=Anguilla anguilla TaxID=7936 RepID=A0A0E9Q1B3_ANGAN